MPDQVINLAGRLLDLSPDPIPRYRIMKDLIMYETDSSDIMKAKEKAMSSKQIQTLIRQQSAVGSWGNRFFTRNKNVKNPAKTTETALIRLNALAVDAENSAMQRVIIYMEKLIDGRLRWPDKIDKSLQNELAMKLVIVSRLSELAPYHPYVLDYAEKLKTVLNAAFEPGFLDESQLAEATKDVMGYRITSECQICFSLYPLILLRNKLDYELQLRWIDHIFKKRRGIYLVNNRSLMHLPLNFPSEESMRFINAMDLLSWYPAAVSYLDSARIWLWDQINNDGFWDFGKFGRDGLELPISENWRTDQNRQIDSSVRVLSILQRLQRTCSVRDTLCHFL